MENLNEKERARQDLIEDLESLLELHSDWMTIQEFIYEIYSFVKDKADNVFKHNLKEKGEADKVDLYSDLDKIIFKNSSKFGSHEFLFQIAFYLAYSFLEEGMDVNCISNAFLAGLKTAMSDEEESEYEVRGENERR